MNFFFNYGYAVFFKDFNRSILFLTFTTPNLRTHFNGKGEERNSVNDAV
ncbi:hypothetical protein CHRY9293_01327 [Chryseobacterium potabilaquae]|uniref:Uncharacterized protein n=1 Tax=Chryseobacterium potabilaquae TaxID=2675057 RepID=A0A6N4X9N3_9FLAO|nr:hypothetical protein CHRY9293_01327 [Chryseobacterium potabilaquae]